MGNLIFLLVGVVFNFNNPTIPFDNSDYVSESIVVEMLEKQYVQDFSSFALYSTMEKFMVNHFDEINHITGHYAKETDMYYYTVYGTNNGERKFDLLEVSKDNFKAGIYHTFENPLPSAGSCRKGNGYPFWPVCQSTYCMTQTTNCLGIICHPLECLNF